MTWRCFHCDESFNDESSAALHFGTRISHDPACTIDVAKYREMEKRMESYNEEDAEIHRTMYAMQGRHREALIREEEKGYARGLADAKRFPEELGLMAKPDVPA